MAIDQREYIKYRGTFIDTQTLTLGETQTSSVGGKEGKEEEEEVEAKEEERET